MMNNPINAGTKINPRFKHFNFSRDQLPIAVLDALLGKEHLKVVEVGVEYGGYLDIYYPVLQAAVEKFYLVDLWQTEGNDDHFIKFTDRAEQGYARVRKLYGSNSKVEICKGSSIERSKDFPNEFFDYIYIDANHTKNAVLQDLEVWYPKLKVGGIIAGHDTYCDPNNVSYEFFDVEGALEEFFTEDQQEEIYLTNEYAYKTWMYAKK
jgi:hypothetical protein